WIVGLVVTNALSDKIPSHASDQQLLAWIQGNQTTVILGGWLFMLGCAAFVWFAVVLRSRLLAAEGGAHTFTTLAFGGAVGTAVLGMLIPAGDVGSAIDHDSISAATAGAFHHLNDVFFVGAELFAVVFFAAVAVCSLRTRALPKWWALLALLIAVVLIIG